MDDRRSFLRGLVSLPLIGGSVVLIGAPTEAAVPVTPRLLQRYEAWLDLERSYVLRELYGREQDGRFDQPIEIVWRDRRTGRCWDSHHVLGDGRFDHSNPGTRAAVVLSAVACPLR